MQRRLSVAISESSAPVRGLCPGRSPAPACSQYTGRSRCHEHREIRSRRRARSVSSNSLSLGEPADTAVNVFAIRFKILCTSIILRPRAASDNCHALMSASMTALGGRSDPPFFSFGWRIKTKLVNEPRLRWLWEGHRGNQDVIAQTRQPSR